MTIPLVIARIMVVSLRIHEFCVTLTNLLCLFFNLLNLRYTPLYIQHSKQIVHYKQVQSRETYHSNKRTIIFSIQLITLLH